MAAPSIAASVFKLAVAGEQAGFTLEQMIELLNAGLTVESAIADDRTEAGQGVLRARATRLLTLGDVMQVNCLDLQIS